MVELELGDVIYILLLWWYYVVLFGWFNVLVNYWWKLVLVGGVVIGMVLGVLLYVILVFCCLSLVECVGWCILLDYYVFGDVDLGEYILVGCCGVLGEFMFE